MKFQVNVCAPVKTCKTVFCIDPGSQGSSKTYVSLILWYNYIIIMMISGKFLFCIVCMSRTVLAVLNCFEGKTSCDLSVVYLPYCGAWSQWCKLCIYSKIIAEFSLHQPASSYG